MKAPIKARELLTIPGLSRGKGWGCWIIWRAAHKGLFVMGKLGPNVFEIQWGQAHPMLE
jgi:hypothetical protein